MALQSQQTPLEVTPLGCNRLRSFDDHRACCTGKYLSFPALSSLSGMTRPYPTIWFVSVLLDDPLPLNNSTRKTQCPQQKGSSPVLSKRTGSTTHGSWSPFFLPVMKVAGTVARSLSKASMCTAFFSSFETSNCPQGSRRIKIRTESSPQRSFDLEVFPVGDSLPHSQPQEKLP